MRPVLAIDAALGACAAAVYDAGLGQTLAVQSYVMSRGHAEVLMPMIERVMRGTGYESLDAVAVTAGPGAFTGLRIGLAAARGIALAADIPAIGVSAFAAIAAAIPDAELAGRAIAVIVAAVMLSPVRAPPRLPPARR